MKKLSLFLFILIVAISFTFAESLMQVLCVPLFSSNKIEIRNLNDLSLIATISDEKNISGPNSATLSSDGKYYYVSNRSSKKISVISVNTYEIVNTIAISGATSLYGVSFDVLNNTLYVGSNYGIYVVKLKDNLYEAESSSFERISTDTIYNCAILDSKLYFVQNGKSSLNIYDLTTKTTKTIDLSKSDENLKSLNTVNISPDGRWLLVTGTAQNKGGLIDLTTVDNATPTVKVFSKNIWYGDFSKDSKYVYYATQNLSSVGSTDLYKCPIEDITSGTNVSLKSIQNCYSFGITEDEHYAYVLSYNSNKLFKIDLTTMSVEKEVSAEGPYIAGGFMPTTYNFRQYEILNEIDVNFNYNGFGGTDFSIKGKKNESANYASINTPTDYSSWTDAAKLQFENWDEKVANPTSQKAKFLGWYTDSAFSTPSDFNAPLTDSVTFYAKWKKYNHVWKYFAKGNKIYAYCDNASDECGCYGKEQAISLGIMANTGKVDYNMKPSTVTNPQVFYTSDNPEVAKVDRNGNVKAIGEGTATITLTAQDESNVSASYTVKVMPHN